MKVLAYRSALCRLEFINLCYRRSSSTTEVMKYLRASEASETLSGVTNGNRRYIYIYIYIYIYMVLARHFSSAGPVLRNVRGVKCQPVLKRSNYL